MNEHIAYPSSRAITQKGEAKCQREYQRVHLPTIWTTPDKMWQRIRPRLPPEKAPGAPEHPPYPSEKQLEPASAKSEKHFGVSRMKHAKTLLVLNRLPNHSRSGAGSRVCPHIPAPATTGERTTAACMSTDAFPYVLSACRALVGVCLSCKHSILDWGSLWTIRVPSRTHALRSSIWRVYGVDRYILGTISF